MYKDDIKILRSEKREAKKLILMGFIKIYLGFKIHFPHLEEERNALVTLLKYYLECDRNESEVLTAINQKYGTLDDHEGIDEILDEFDEMFLKLYDHCESTFYDYEDFYTSYGDFIDLLMLRIQCIDRGESYQPGIEFRYRLKHRKMNFQTFNQDYKQKILERIQILPEPKEEEF